MEKQWYEELFTNFAQSYEKEDFTKGTLQECDFIEKEIEYNRNKLILDIGCGTGRHSIELARRGYRVTGIDLSPDQLRMAISKADTAGVFVEFIQKDARHFNFNQQFDLAIMICEGAFPLMETDEMNFQILQNAFSSLKPDGKLIFTTLNVLFPLFHSVKDFINSNSEMISMDNTFDLMTFRDYSKVLFDDDSGNKRLLHCNERYYAPSEITWLLKSIGFSTVQIFGGVLGNFSRDKKLSHDDYEMLVITEKPAKS